MSEPLNIADLEAALRAASASPRLVWYGPEGERVELSGRVIDNWVAKTSNLLVEELDATPGTEVLLDTPPHWKSLVWALACWQTGAVVRLGEAEPRAAEGAADEPAAPGIIRVAMDAPAEGPLMHSPNEILVLVAPGALAMRWSAHLPAGAIDYAAEVRSFGDVFLDQPTTTTLAETPLIAGADGQLNYGDLIAIGRQAQGKAAADPAVTPVLVVPAALPLQVVLAVAVKVWALDGTVILVHPEVEVTDRLLAGERVTAQLTS